jgi:aspartyl protease family protein
MHEKFVFGAIGMAALVGLMAPGQSPDTTNAVRIVAENESQPATHQTSSGFATHIQRSGDGHFYANADVNGRPVRFLVDTGASTIALTMADAQSVGLAVDPSEFSVIGRGASGEVTGKVVTLDSVSIDGKSANGVRAAILADGLEVSLLGQSYLSQLSQVKIEGDQLELR